MPGTVNAKIIWENNPDTSLSSSNLSKSIDFISDSKFIEYINTDEAYSKWADFSITNRVPLAIYYDKIIYITSEKKFYKGSKNQDETPGFITYGFIPPNEKLLKIKANTKVAMSYTNLIQSQINLNYEIGNEDSFFSVESLIIENDFSPNTVYYIYLYNSSTTGDFSQLKIVSKYNDDNNTSDWKNGDIDSNSPTGRRVIAIRKIGGFKTNSNGKIDESSLWDLSTYKKEITPEKYKIFEDNKARDLNAADIPIIDSKNNFDSNNVEEALSDMKTNLNQLYGDMYYTADKYGVELEFSIFYENNGNLQPINLNANSTLLIPLRITPGYINVFGRRINIESPIYFGKSNFEVKINSYPGTVSGIKLGGAPVNPYDPSLQSAVIYPGIWRVFIDTDGTIILREGDTYLPQFIVNTIQKGWYYSGDNSRCIGKFKVTSNNGYYVEKMSITNTFDIQVPKNTVHIFHGTMCPDGLFLCDGLWHDTNGKSSLTYENMPMSNVGWGTSWWDQTPNMLGRTIKMFDREDFVQNTGGSSNLKVINQNAFTWRLNTNGTQALIVSGSSPDCGAEDGSASHVHSINHKHDPGEIRIVSNQNDVHGHATQSFVTQPPPTPVYAVQHTNEISFVQVAPINHTHSGLIQAVDGKHGHSTSSFSGQVSNPTIPDSATTSSWAPYKEFIICIKK